MLSPWQHWMLSENPSVVDPVLIDEPDETGDTALHKAVRMGLTDNVSKLVRTGATIDMHNYQGLTALHLAVECNRQEILDILVHSGANCGLRWRNETALYLAAKYGFAEMVRSLVPASDVNARGP